MSARLCVVLASLLIAALPGCSDDAPQNCDGGGLVCSLSVDPQLQRANDGGATYIVTINARIPNLQGGAQANVSTSDGTVADAKPGSEATVFLPGTPAAPRNAGTLSGKVTWSVPPRDTAQLTVRIDERTATAVVQTP
jgi:hypothetical protein